MTMAQKNLPGTRCSIVNNNIVQGDWPCELPPPAVVYFSKIETDQQVQAVA